VTRLAAAAAGVCIVVSATFVVPVLLRDVAENAELAGGEVNYAAPMADSVEPVVADGEMVADFDDEWILGEPMNEMSEDDGDFADAFPAPAMPAPEEAADSAFPDSPMSAPAPGGGAGAGANEDTRSTLTSFEPALSYYDFATYRDWPDGSLWDNLVVEIRERQPRTPISQSTPQGYGYAPGHDGAPTVFPETEIFYDMPEQPVPPPMPNFGDLTVYSFAELADMFLNREHKLTSFGYETEIPEWGMYEHRHGVFNETSSLPVYSMLSKYLQAPCLRLDLINFPFEGVRMEIKYSEGYLLDTVFIHVTPEDGMFIWVAGYDGQLLMNLDSGEYRKLRAYLEHLS
jgi:hypothetical protein